MSPALRTPLFLVALALLLSDPAQAKEAQTQRPALPLDDGRVPSDGEAAANAQRCEDPSLRPLYAGIDRDLRHWVRQGPRHGDGVTASHDGR
jgi:hypothetical protein